MEMEREERVNLISVITRNLSLLDANGTVGNISGRERSNVAVPVPLRFTAESARCDVTRL